MNIFCDSDRDIIQTAEGFRHARAPTSASSLWFVSGSLHGQDSLQVTNGCRPAERPRHYQCTPLLSMKKKKGARQQHETASTYIRLSFCLRVCLTVGPPPHSSSSLLLLLLLLLPLPHSDTLPLAKPWSREEIIQKALCMEWNVEKKRKRRRMKLNSLPFQGLSIVLPFPLPCYINA